MTACRSWRPNPATTHQPAHLPRECRKCWAPCRNTAIPGGQRCNECLLALAQHPSAVIRKSLASESDLDRGTLEMLTTDPDFGVRVIASAALEKRSDFATIYDRVAGHQVTAGGSNAEAQ